MELDGYLTGVVVSPDLLLPSRWLDRIWGESEPTFDGLDQMQTVIAAVPSSAGARHKMPDMSTKGELGCFLPIGDWNCSTVKVPKVLRRALEPTGTPPGECLPPCTFNACWC